jgi:hypothetical protein
LWTIRGAAICDGPEKTILGEHVVIRIDASQIFTTGLEKTEANKLALPAKRILQVQARSLGASAREIREHEQRRRPPPPISRGGGTPGDDPLVHLFESPDGGLPAEFAMNPSEDAVAHDRSCWGGCEHAAKPTCKGIDIFR